MKKKKQAKFVVGKLMVLILLTLALIFLLEPTFRDNLSFAVTYFDSSKVSESQVNSTYPIAEIPSPVTPQKSRAPEPSTLFLILSGLSGIIIRFAQKSFEKFKRISDIALSIIGLIIASPILIFAAILIKLNSRGPIVYKQERMGKEGKIFDIYKLRTMSADAEKETGAVWAREDDPRITPVGRILRKFHIDELPQLFNVINGQMSIVGPRPERPEIVEKLKEEICDYEKRLSVKPGITGLAQIRHKYDETISDVRKKIKYDILYIKKMCWLLEARILARTFVVALIGKGAR